MASGGSLFDQAELQAIIDRLRREVQQTQSGAVDDADRSAAGQLRTRRELDRTWAVTAERPYLYRPGLWGRIRGAVLIPPKAVLRRLMRWYVEPFAMDQRAFNGGVLRLTDELAGRLVRLERKVASLEERQPKDAPPAPGR
jgi:hypothetical protein